MHLFLEFKHVEADIKQGNLSLVEADKKALGTKGNGNAWLVR